MSDPLAEQKARLYADNLAAIRAISRAAREDLLRRAELGQARGGVQRQWLELFRERWAERAKVTAADIGQSVARQLDAPEFDEERASAYLDGFGRRASLTWEQHIELMLEDVDLASPDLRGEVDRATSSLIADLAEENAQELTFATANFAAIEVARSVGRPTKTWNTGSNPRATHAALNRVTVPIDAVFPNGLRYPRSPGPPQETARCNCYVTFGG